MPVSYDGINEYIIMHNSKCLVYVDKKLYVRGKINLSRSRQMAWPSTCSQWLLNGTEDQIDFINESFAPTSEEIAEGKKVLEEYQKSGGGAVKIDGQMVDEPIAEAMRLKISLGEEESED